MKNYAVLIIAACLLSATACKKCMLTTCRPEAVEGTYLISGFCYNQSFPTGKISVNDTFWVKSLGEDKIETRLGFDLANHTMVGCVKSYDCQYQFRDNYAWPHRIDLVWFYLGSPDSVSIKVSQESGLPCCVSTYYLSGQRIQ